MLGSMSARVAQIVNEVERRRSNPASAELFRKTEQGLYQPTPANADDPMAIYPSSALGRISLEHVLSPLSFYRLQPNSLLLEMTTGSGDVYALIPEPAKEGIKTDAGELVDRVFAYLQNDERDEMTEDLFMDTARVVLNGYFEGRNRDIFDPIMNGVMGGHKYFPIAETILAAYLLEEGLEQGLVHEYFTVQKNFMVSPDQAPEESSVHELIFYGRIQSRVAQHDVHIYAASGTLPNSELFKMLAPLVTLPIDTQPTLVQAHVMKKDAFSRQMRRDREPTAHQNMYALHLEPYISLTDK